MVGPEVGLESRFLEYLEDQLEFRRQAGRMGEDAVIHRVLAGEQGRECDPRLSGLGMVRTKDRAFAGKSREVRGEVDIGIVCAELVAV